MNLTPAQKKALKKIPAEWTPVQDTGVIPAVLSALISKQLVEAKSYQTSGALRYYVWGSVRRIKDAK